MMDKRAQEVILRKAISTFEVQSVDLRRLAEETSYNYIDWALAKIDEAIGNLKSYASAVDIQILEKMP